MKLLNHSGAGRKGKFVFINLIWELFPYLFLSAWPFVNICKLLALRKHEYSYYLCYNHKARPFLVISTYFIWGIWPNFFPVIFVVFCVVFFPLRRSTCSCHVNISTDMSLQVGGDAREESSPELKIDWLVRYHWAIHYDQIWFILINLCHLYGSR